MSSKITNNEADFTVEPIILAFIDDLTAVKFLQNGVPVDPIEVLFGLARGVLVFSEYEIELSDPTPGLSMRFVKSKTYKIAPKKAEQ